MLERVLEEYGETIAARWVELVFGTYPEESRRFLSAEGDAFANPVGRTVRDASGALVGALAAGRVDERARAAIGELMRIRSVQDLTVAEAVGAVPLLRRAVLDVVRDGLDPAAERELAARVEGLTLAACEAFVFSRERLWEARMAERDRHRASLIARAERVLAGRAPAAVRADGS